MIYELSKNMKDELALLVTFVVVFYQNLTPSWDGA